MVSGVGFFFGSQYALNFGLEGFKFILFFPVQTGTFRRFAGRLALPRGETWRIVWPVSWWSVRWPFHIT